MKISCFQPSVSGFMARERGHLSARQQGLESTSRTNTALYRNQGKLKHWNIMQNPPHKRNLRKSNNDQFEAQRAISSL